MKNEIEKLQELTDAIQRIVDNTPEISDVTIDRFKGDDFVARVYLLDDPDGLMRDAVVVEHCADYPGACRLYNRRKTIGHCKLVLTYTAIEEEAYRAKWGLPLLLGSTGGAGGFPARKESPLGYCETVWPHTDSEEVGSDET